ncbi:MAG: histidine--tRNA ligase [Roseiflexaceae bacterium]|nr:histidine--tRNA ligase [Roseiflexaceae bacterium]
MSNKPQNIKGMRDHLPKAMILRQYIVDTLAGVFERHGFEPMQTPILEYAETLEGKIGDEEKLIYRFDDHGGRRLALRYDQTVPLARVVAQYPNEITLPFRRYAVGQSYRGERPARGRYREFWQVDLDLVGSASPLADAEVVAIIDECLTALGFTNFTTQLNHRQILGGIARVSGLGEEAAGGVYRAIDKLDKIGADGVRQELLQSGVAEDAAARILELVQLKGANGDVLEELSERLANDQRALAALDNLRAIISGLDAMGVPEQRFAITPGLARGLSYYTGVVFESVVENPPMGSLLGGGRYDELIGQFSGRALPTVGLAFGLERLHDVIEELGLAPQITLADVFVTIFGPDLAGAALAVARDLRAAGLNAEIALDPAEKLGRQFKHADKRGIALAVVIGPDELARGEVVVRDMRSGEQRSVARAEVVQAVRTARAANH